MTNKFKYHYDRRIDFLPEELDLIINKGKKTNLEDLAIAQKKLKEAEQRLEAYKTEVRILKSQTECHHNKHIIVHEHGVSCDWCNAFFRSETELEITNN